VTFRILDQSDTYIVPDESIATAFIPKKSHMLTYVLTDTTDLTLSLLVTANVAADRLALDDSSPVDPHDTTTLDGFASLNEDASHFTQDETLNGDEPVGSVDNIDVDKYDPLEKTRAVLGNDDEELEWLMPVILDVVTEKADTSEIDPER
jgi:hypothetical protein